ncbi:chromosome partitioning protein ParB [Haematobacter massiliensis]|nr:chromosome partitioning protein ParB [Haematobacter massiliensis]OWJ87453.1 chromosome partitioning protein ParB [Haematobacter massiliensis]
MTARSTTMSDPVTALVPLSDLYIHPLNTRSAPPDAEIAALADSIAQLGLLQNLSGFRDPVGKLGIDPMAVETRIGIVAGGRRLRALQLLAGRDGRDADAVTVPVLLTENEDTARLWASAENAARRPLHPADEVRAYARMSTTGADPATIAKAFAVTERHVRQRMTLATLPAAALDALRGNQITLDQAGALTSAQSEEALLAELRRVLTTTWGISAADIRRNLAPRGVRLDDRRVKWLGLDTYRSAGGAMREDLFSDDVALLDEALLDKLFRERLEEFAALQLSEGYAWAKVHAENACLPYDVTQDLLRVDMIPVDLPEADAEELERLLESSDLTDEEIERLNELEKRSEGDISDEDRATSGVYIYVNSEGQLILSGPWREKEAKPQTEDVADTSKVEKLSNSLVEDLHRIRRLAIQTALLEKPELALDLLTVALTAPVWNWDRPLAISLSPEEIMPEKADATTVDDRLADAVNKGSAGSTDLSPAHLLDIQGMGKKARNALLTTALARLYEPQDGDFAALVAKLSGANIRACWTPTAENYFSRLPVARLDAIWAELVPGGGPDGDGWLSMKKALKAKDLDRLFRDQDFRDALFLTKEDGKRIEAWLPAELQWPSEAEAPSAHEEAA